MTDPILNKIIVLRIFIHSESVTPHEVEECVRIDRQTCHLLVQNIPCRLVVFKRGLFG